MSRSILPSATMRTRVAADVETERSKEGVKELEEPEEVEERSAADALGVLDGDRGCNRAMEAEDCLAARGAE